MRWTTFQPDLDSAQKITWENILGNISMKNEIFVNFYSFLSVEKNDLMMVLFFGLIRIQRVKIHKNSRVSTPAQYTFFLWACGIIHVAVSIIYQSWAQHW